MATADHDDGFYLTLQEFEDLMQGAVVSILGWDAISPSKENDVRISWPKQGAPAMGIDDDIVFLRVNEQGGEYSRMRESFVIDSSPGLLETVSFTRIMEVFCIIYGPNSFDNAQTIRNGMFRQSIKESLAEEKVHLVPEIIAPRRVPELFAGQWWDRCDMRLVFNELIKHEYESEYIETADINISDGSISVDVSI